MIKSIVRKESKIVSKLDCLLQLDEVRKKILMVKGLLKEYVIITEIEQFDKTPINLLCETLITLSRTHDLLSKMYSKNKEKPEIRITADEASLYFIYYASLYSISSELKSLYNILLIPEQDMM
jgi:hypothetical protein